MVAVGSSVLAIAVGIVVGSLSGYYGGWIDALLSRTFDLFLLIPTFFLVLLIIALFGSSITLTMLAIAVTTWPKSARIMRSQVLSLKSRVYVQSAKAAGASNLRVLKDHVVPNGLAPIVTDATILMGAAILTEAGLSFLGLGDQNQVSWGRMIFEAQRQLRLAPWISIFPGVCMLDPRRRVQSPRRWDQPCAQSAAAHPRRSAEAAASRPPPANEPAAGSGPMLEVEDLRLAYRLGDREIRAVDGVSFTIPKGGSLGIVGESGCGKSSLGSALLQVLPANAELTGGNVSIDGRAVLLGGRPVGEGGKARFQALRWTRMSMIFQSAMNALNPVLTVRQQLIEAYLLHRPSATKREAEARVAAVFDMIGIARDRMASYPHELSGGMRQRVMIALSLLLEPDLVIADEPTTALDVLIQDQILGEIDNLRRKMNLTLILISHDMGTVAETCEMVAVMYAGQIVETAPTNVIFDRPGHPYTRALIDALPDLHGPKRKLAALPGEPFAPSGDVVGCRFAPRCRHATDLCRSVAPPHVRLAFDHHAACHYAQVLTPRHVEEIAS